MRHFWWFSNNVNEVRILLCTLHNHHLICCIEIDKKSQWGMKSNSYNSSIVILIWPCIPKKFQRFSVFLSEKSAPNPRDHDLDSDDDPSSNNHVLAIWHRQLLFTNPNLDRFEAEAQLKMNGIQFRQNCRCVWTKKVVHKTARRSRCNWSIFNHFKA